MGPSRCGNYDSAKEEGFVSKAVPLGLTEQDIEGFGELNIAGGGGEGGGQTYCDVATTNKLWGRTVLENGTDGCNARWFPVSIFW